MVVKLFFTDGFTEVRSFSDEDLCKLNLTFALLNFFNEKILISNKVDTFELVDEEFFKNHIPSAFVSIYEFDIRDYFNYSNSFIGLELGGRKVDRVEFFEENTYEYNLDSLTKPSYKRFVKFNHPYESYNIGKYSRLGK